MRQKQVFHARKQTCLHILPSKICKLFFLPSSTIFAEFLAPHHSKTSSYFEKVIVTKQAKTPKNVIPLVANAHEQRLMTLNFTNAKLVTSPRAYAWNSTARRTLARDYIHSTTQLKHKQWETLFSMGIRALQNEHRNAERVMEQGTKLCRQKIITVSSVDKIQ